MPKLWNETIEAHRAAVRDAILETTATLAFEHGLASVTMSQVAEVAGIGRATLYKYFPDVETILLAWHERRVSGHLEQLTGIRDRIDDPDDRLRAVLEAYALINHRRPRHGTDLSEVLHADEHIAGAQRHLHEFIAGLLKEADVRKDVPADELAAYCLYALAAGSALPSKAAVDRLVTVTLAGLRP